jgi:hypothetical protein
MQLKTLINKSVYGTIGYVSSLEDLNLIEQYILFNISVLKEFKQIVVATNYGADLQTETHLLWKKHFPDCVNLDSKVNRGHNHGYADLDNLIFDYCKLNDIEWLCKSANDTVMDISILEKVVDNADFYYLNGIGYGGMVKYNFDFNQIIQKDFYPQTNFYFINVSKVDYLNNSTYLDETFNYINQLPDYNGRIWEYVEGWSCEDFLKNCVTRNNLSKYHLISQEKYYNLLYLIKDNYIHDSSHKNIMVEGICHFHQPINPVLTL